MAFLQVICVGQIVCTVAADTYAHAKEAAKQVKIAYEDIEPRIITIKVVITLVASGMMAMVYFGQNPTHGIK